MSIRTARNTHRLTGKAQAHVRTALLLACLAAALCLLLCSCGSSTQATTAALTTSSAPSTQRTVGGVKSLSAYARVYNSNAMIDTLVVEYGTAVVLPSKPDQGYSTLYEVKDSTSTYGQRQVVAVYTNSAPEKRADRTSVEGPYVIIELNAVGPDASSLEKWSPSTDAGTAVTEKNGVSQVRTDYSGLSVIQCFDAKDAKGTVERAKGTLPQLQNEDVHWPQLREFAIDQVYSSSAGNLHYSYYVPHDYDPSQSYPLMVVVPGENAYLVSTDRGTDPKSAGVNLVADTQVIAWTTAPEDVIVLAVQPAATDAAAAAQTWELIDWFRGQYSIDPARIYASGYAGGAQIMSQVVDAHADVFAAYVNNSGVWSGGLDNAAADGLALYFYRPLGDETVDANSFATPYLQLRDNYRYAGMTRAQVDALLVLDQRENAYFDHQGATSYHAGGRMIFNDAGIVQWVLAQHGGTDGDA